jgi:adenylate kinase family enzyme
VVGMSFSPWIWFSTSSRRHTNSQCHPDEGRIALGTRVHEPRCRSLHRRISASDGTISVLMQRIVVTGSTGAGKSTLARALARRLGVPHVELDALYWDPNWTAAPRDVLMARAEAALPVDSGWVTDGNYRSLREISWSRADTLVWLDYPLPLVFWRLTVRCFSRGIRRTELFNGNREELWKHFFTRESLFLWLMKTHHSRGREIEAGLTRPEYSHLRVHRFRWPKQAQTWLDRVSR